jgi:hypothetical protein
MEPTKPSAKQADWKTLPLPAAHSVLKIDRRYTPADIETIQRGLVPKQMEDKWLIYWNDSKLFFHRSWSGNCIYVATFRAEQNGYQLVNALVNREQEQYRGASDEYDKALLLYLIDALLLGRDCEFPSSESYSDHPSVQKWSLVGRGKPGNSPSES